MSKFKIHAIDSPCPRAKLLESAWAGVAIYDDAIVFRAGKSLLILDDDGLHVNATDIVTTKEEPPIS